MFTIEQEQILSSIPLEPFSNHQVTTKIINVAASLSEIPLTDPYQLKALTHSPSKMITGFITIKKFDDFIYNSRYELDALSEQELGDFIQVYSMYIKHSARRSQYDGVLMEDHIELLERIIRSPEKVGLTSVMIRLLLNAILKRVIVRPDFAKMVANSDIQADLLFTCMFQFIKQPALFNLQSVQHELSERLLQGMKLFINSDSTSQQNLPDSHQVNSIITAIQQYVTGTQNSHSYHNFLFKNLFISRQFNLVYLQILKKQELQHRFRQWFNAHVSISNTEHNSYNDDTITEMFQQVLLNNSSSAHKFQIKQIIQENQIWARNWAMNYFRYEKSAIIKMFLNKTSYGLFEFGDDDEFLHVLQEYRYFDCLQEFVGNQQVKKEVVTLLKWKINSKDIYESILCSNPALFVYDQQ